MTSVLSTFGALTRSPGFKFFLILGLIVLLLVPLVMVSFLVMEREGRAEGVKAEVASYWGGPQRLSGPYLVVPYTQRREVVSDGKRIEETVEQRAVLVPEELKITADLRPETLRRSIFEVNVYTADLVIEGRFNAPDLSELDPKLVAARWRDATLALPITGVQGLKEAAVLEIEGGGSIPLAPSLGLPGATQSGIHARLGGEPRVIPGPDAAALPFSFRIHLVLTGSSSLMTAPTARETSVSMKSSWPHPSFAGAFLPADRSVGESGFTATWKVPHLARNVPNAWLYENDGLGALAGYHFGVNLYSPVDFYDLVSRAVKYALLFLSIGFMGVFVLEVLSGRRIHPVQYILTGTAMLFFYVLLLSLAEHIGFGWSYLIASCATGGMLSLYVARALESVRSGLSMLVLFLVSYGFLYMILTLEDYALLAGAILGFTALTVVMFATLKIDWSSPGPFPEAKA